MAIVLFSTAAGIGATRLVPPMYEVQSRVMIANDSPVDSRLGPIRGTGLLSADDWVALLRSSRIADAVVRELALYLRPASGADAWMFSGFSLADQVAFGQYELRLDKARKRWTLVLQRSEFPVDSGGVADSVGAARLGFRWLLPPSAFSGTGVSRVKFTVSTPREAANELINRLVPRKQPESKFFDLTIQDRDGQRAATIINTWTRKYIATAAELKKTKLTEFAKTLEGQLQTAKSALDSAEGSLSSYRGRIITLPQDNVPIAAGVAQTTDPVIKDYFDRKIRSEDIGHDIVDLQRLLRAAAQKDSVPSEAILRIPSVAAPGPANRALVNAFEQYHQAESSLAALRVGFQDEHPAVKAQIDLMNSIKHEKIPQYANELLSSLRAQSAEDSVRIASAGANIQQIPQRTIDEERRRRVRDIDAGLYTNLQNRYQEAQLAEASATPDVSVLDTAIAPLFPTKNTASRMILYGLVFGLGAAIALAILLDKLDGRLRYPEQATEELGLPIVGTVPRFPKRGLDRNSPEQMFQLVESFRSLRMAVTYSTGSNVSLAVSSPSPSEGKSLISANLAMSFADAGIRTILVDGDTRRGALNAMFGLSQGPGLTDYLAGKASRRDIMKQSHHQMLTVIPCGQRLRRSPELLTSPQLRNLINDLRAQYQVVIVDTPPLAAGVDAYSIAAATGSLIIVLRVGQTQRRLAVEKLRMLDRLPVNVLGAVLNGIEFEGGYEYYGYVSGYEAVDEVPGTAVADVR